MPRPQKIYTNLYPYHVTTHLVDELYFKNADLDMCVELLRKTSAEFNTKIISYNFMPNHYHIILQTFGENLNQVMHSFNLSVSKKFNLLNNRKGHVWRRRYHTILIRSDAQLLICMRYVDRNPMAAKIVDDPTYWRWSSIREYVDQNSFDIITPPDVFTALSDTHEKRYEKYKSLVMEPIQADKIPKKWKLEMK